MKSITETTKQNANKVIDSIGQGIVGAVVMGGLYIGIYSERIDANREHLIEVRQAIEEIKSTRFKRADADVLAATLEMKMKSETSILSNQVNRLQADVKDILIEIRKKN